MKAFLIAAAVVMTAAPPNAPAKPVRAATQALPAGEYRLDKPHASLTFSVSHMGFSHYTARFTSFDAHMTLDPAHPEKAQLTATIDPASLELNAPPAGFHDELLGKDWLDVKLTPQWTFTSTKIVKTGPRTARVIGDFTMHGITKPVTLDVTFNGGYPGLAGMDPHARLGFSAHGMLKRSDFGVTFGIPAPGTTLGVSDEVNITLESEFTGPPLKN